MEKIKLKSFGRDNNGNSIIKFSILNSHQMSDVTLNGRKIKTDKEYYSYSVQTNGNTPLLHRAKMDGKKAVSLGSEYILELREFLQRHGSDKQKFLLQ